MIIKPKYGVNLRLSANELIDQFALMQNVDMTHGEDYEQIKGSVRYHGSTIGSAAPSAIMPYYDNYNNVKADLVAVDDKIYKKNEGANEFTEIKSGLTPYKIKQHIDVKDKKYIAHPSDGLLEFNGVSSVEAVNDIKLIDIIISKETNRCFGITVNNELAWTDDLSTMAGVPLVWNPLNVAIIPSTKGDIQRKLFILNGRLVIFLDNSIWIYYINGSPSNWRPEKAPTVVGLLAPQTVRQVGEEIWFLGDSPDTGIGIYAFNGRTCRLLSYDIEPFLKRMNPYKKADACADIIDNIYKISIAIDASPENNYTFHLDTINQNKDTGAPNIYGPHTYGFSASAVTRDGKHLFARKHSDGARVFKVADYKTQYSTELDDDGDLIPGVLLTAIYDKEILGKNIYDSTWMKRYEKIFLGKIPTGTFGCLVEILKGYENETYSDYTEYMEGENYSGESITLGSDPFDFESRSDAPHLGSVLSDAIQLKITNHNLQTRFKFTDFQYDFRPVRRKKHAQIVSI